jgi:CheY-like chemotaxis protein
MTTDGISHIFAGLIILVVEDADDERGALAATLSSHGAYVVTAGSIEEALAVMRRVTPNVLVSNIDLPRGEHSLGLIRRIRKIARGGKVRALAVIGSAEPDGRTAGYQEHLHKPIAVDELLDAIERIVGRALGERPFGSPADCAMEHGRQPAAAQTARTPRRGDGV